MVFLVERLAIKDPGQSVYFDDVWIAVEKRVSIELECVLRRGVVADGHLQEI